MGVKCGSSLLNGNAIDRKRHYQEVLARKFGESAKRADSRLCGNEEWDANTLLGIPKKGFDTMCHASYTESE